MSLRALVTVAFLLSVSSTAHAALLGRLPVTPGGTDYQAVYDDDRNITWIADANLPDTNPFGVSGIGATGNLTQPTALAWIDAMNANGGYLGFQNWRLPGASLQDPACSNQGTQVDDGFGCTGSELGHLFYIEFGAAQGVTVQFNGDPDLNLFQHIQFSKLYWFSTINTFDPSLPAFVHDASVNSQILAQVANLDGYFAWAVRDGDVGDVAVAPLPNTAWLFGVALAALVLATRRRAVITRAG